MYIKYSNAKLNCQTIEPQVSTVQKAEGGRDSWQTVQVEFNMHCDF